MGHAQYVQARRRRALATRARGGVCVEVAALDLGHDLPTMHRAITPKTRIVFVANPNNPTGTWLPAAPFEAFIASVPEDTLVVLDEAQYIKNPRSKMAQAACKLDARNRLCLSGTPIENHLGELWSLMNFLVPGFLGTEDAFNKRFRTPIEKDGDMERNAVLKSRVAPLILRRTKDQVAKELPPKTELVHLIELNTGQKDLYETVRATMDKRVREAIAARGLNQSRIVFLEALLKLRQICCDPRLLKLEGESKFEADTAGSGKLDYLFELLEKAIDRCRDAGNVVHQVVLKNS